MKPVKVIFLALIISALALLLGCNSSSSDPENDNSKITKDQKLVAGYALSSANASAKVVLDASTYATDELFILPTRSVRLKTVQSLSEKIDYTFDSDGDGYDDLNIIGSVSSNLGVDPKVSVNADITVKFTRDAIFQDDLIEYTIKADSSLSQTFNNNIISLIDLESRVNSTTALNKFEMTWVKDSDTISSNATGSILLTYEGIMNNTSKSYDITGTIHIDLRSIIIVNGETTPVEIEGTSKFSLVNNQYSDEGSYIITIDGKTFGPYSLEELNSDTDLN